MSFTHDDVQRIIQLLDASHFDELHLEADGIKLDLRRNAAASGATPSEPAASASSASAAVSSPQAATVSESAASAAATAPSGTGGTSAESGVIEVKAPMLGTFYRAPKPGADHFVAQGSKVGPDTVVGIIEVMKLMNSVPANVTGEVVEVLAGDGELVEYDQVLFRVRP